MLRMAKCVFNTSILFYIMYFFNFENLMIIYYHNIKSKENLILNWFYDLLFLKNVGQLMYVVIKILKIFQIKYSQVQILR